MPLVHQLRLQIDGIEPAVWRRLELTSETTLGELHRVLQAVLAWVDDGEHGFFPPDGEDSLDEAATLAAAAPKGARVDYAYESEGAWNVLLAVEDVKPAEDAVRYPRVVDGARESPPEEVDGPEGYAEILRALADADDPDHEPTREWFGDFDPEHFDVVETQERLAWLDPPVLSPELEALVEKLGSEELPEDVQREVVARGAASVADLVAILDEDKLSTEGFVGDGWPGVHAATLLGEIGDLRALEPLLRAVARTDWDTLLHDRSLLALPKLGPEVLEPVLRAAEAADDDADRTALLGVLADCGAKDERIYQRLLAILERDPEIGAAELTTYGDRRALPALTAALDRFAPKGDDADSAVVELAFAIEELGGTLTSAQRTKLETVRAQLEARRAEEDGEPGGETLVRRTHLGRNDPCWCGSGKKYKKCHLDEDERNPYR